ncbi:MAG: hypothetical protein CFE24_01335 [Flavobacterium sp. BFFFF2]|nr:MAG: hypothetical protein CFE24_01335 [Flavobacterium sp. BFFFF2]
MKKIIFLSLLLLSSCKNIAYNHAMEKIGGFSDEVKTSTLVNTDKSVVFIPMHHIGTQLFYDDVHKKIDSLKALDYYFFYEQIKANSASIRDTITLLKIRKILGVPLSKDAKTDYLSYFKDKEKVKFKKELVSQPQVSVFGLDSKNALNVDCSMNDLITEYENKYGKLELSTCDYETPFYEKSKCPINRELKSKRKTIIVDYRNSLVVREVLKNDHPKIAIIYGELHFVGIKAALLKEGYQQVTPAVK